MGEKITQYPDYRPHQEIKQNKAPVKGINPLMLRVWRRRKADKLIRKKINRNVELAKDEITPRSLRLTNN